jgi:type 1 glutamine amidotransferase/HEAT repeat protein
MGVCAQNVPTVPQDQADQLGALIGTRLTVAPARPHRVLVFWRCEGFVHGQALAYGNKAFELAAAQTHAFQADFATDYAALQPDNLARYDALVLNNTTMLGTTEHPFVEPAIVAFVRSGKGLAVIHSGADNFYKAEQAAEMVGGRFWGHPWGSGGTWAFKLDDPASSLNRAFGGQGFKTGEEIYQQQSPFYTRAKLHVLVSLDLTDPATAGTQGQRRDDKDFAVSWIRPYGQGRVFYTSFGHDQRAFLNKATLFHILDGLQYALGDLKADDTPAGLSAADLNAVRSATADTVNTAFALLQDVAAHTYHAPTEAANKAKLEALLRDPAATPYGKKAVLRALWISGGAKDTAAVAACFAQPETRDWAATLLAQTPGETADRTLVQALAAADPAFRCTLLYALGIRKNADAIIPYIADKDVSVATAAYGALGRIGSETALTALLRPAAAPSLGDARLTALAACIGTLAENGHAKAAAKAARPLFADASVPTAVRAAAARALLLADDDFFAEGLKDASPAVRQTVIRAADHVSVKTLAAALKASAPAEQIALLSKLSARDAKSCAPAVAALLASDQETVVCAALRALTRIGGTEHVPAIYALTARDGDVGRAATDALTDLRAPGTGEALLRLAEKDSAQQPRILALLGDRSESALIPKLGAFLTSPQADVRREAWKALGKTASDAALGQLVAWLPLAQDEELNQAEATVRSAAKNAEAAARTAAFAGAWKTSPVPAKKVLAELMALYADPAFVAPLTGALADNSRDLREAALRALADWPDMSPFAALKDAVTTQTDGSLKTVALRSALKLVQANAGDDARARCLELFKAAPDDKGRMTVADAVFKRDGLGLFPALQSLAADPACGALAKKTYVTFFDQKLKPQLGQALRDVNPKAWKAHASHADHDAHLAFDRKPETRWSSNTPSVKGMWFTLDLGDNAFVSEVILDTEKSGGDTPNGYEVFASNDGKNWTGPVAQGDGTARGKTVIRTAVQTSHLKFVTTDGRTGLHWSIHEIYVKAGLDPAQVEAIGKIADTLR